MHVVLTAHHPSDAALGELSGLLLGNQEVPPGIGAPPWPYLDLQAECYEEVSGEQLPGVGVLAATLGRGYLAKVRKRHSPRVQPYRIFRQENMSWALR